jgi:hypothetical protein
VTRLVLALDGRGRPLVIPVLAITAASLDARTEDGDVALMGLERLGRLVSDVPRPEPGHGLLVLSDPTAY